MVKKNFRLFLMLIMISFVAFVTKAQEEETAFDLAFNVNRVCPTLWITKSKIADANTLVDLNKFFKTEWVKSYKSVEVIVQRDGKTQKAFSKSEILNKDQKELMSNADAATQILVSIDYIPDNNLPEELHNERFILAVDPVTPANFKTGQKNLDQYLKTNALDKVSKSAFEIHQLTAIKFTIDEDGHIINPEIVESSKDQETDEILYQAICEMPNWNPATYGNNLKVKQDFVFTIGDHRSCVINLLNVCQD